MNRADLWAGSTSPDPQAGNVEARSMDTARLIAQRPFSVVISRRDPATQQTIYLAPQVCRLEIVQNIRSAGEQRDNWLDISKQYVVLIGQRGHPTIPDTDIRRADQFLWNGRMYEVVELIDTVPGRLLASAEVTP